MYLPTPAPYYKEQFKLNSTLVFFLQYTKIMAHSQTTAYFLSNFTYIRIILILDVSDIYLCYIDTQIENSEISVI